VLLYFLDAGAAVLYLTPSGTVCEEWGGGGNVVYYGLFNSVIELAYLARIVVALGCVAAAKIGECVRGTADVVYRNIQVVNNSQKCLNTSAR
jgi:hypothetical protein